MSSRREHLRSLLGLASLSCVPLAAGAQSEADIPPHGIGRRIRHVSYSDQGGRPDAVQVMVHRRHVYVGHMFSNGLTILDASDPRNLKPVHYFALGALTRPPCIQVAHDV